MPLSWNITGCADPAALQTAQEWPVTNTIILCMPVIGLGTITEANAAEVYARLDLTQRLNGALMYTVVDGKPQDRNLTPLDVRARIGLRCNVAPETWASFQRRMLQWVRPDAERKYKEAIRRADEPAAVAV